jgi:hypothetical protein
VQDKRYPCQDQSGSGTFEYSAIHVYAAPAVKPTCDQRNSDAEKNDQRCRREGEESNVHQIFLSSRTAARSHQRRFTDEYEKRQSVAVARVSSSV